MTRSLATLAVALTMTGVACMGGHAASSPGPSTAQAARNAPGGMGGMPTSACPMAVPGTQVAVADTADGEAVTFTTAPDQAAELRSRVHAMADMHNSHHQGGGMEGMHGGMQHNGMMGGGSMGSSGGGGAMPMMPPPSRAAVEDVEGGARLVVTPSDPADLDRLRSTVRMHVEHMRQTGTCEMDHQGKM